MPALCVVAPAHLDPALGLLVVNGYDAEGLAADLIRLFRRLYELLS